MALSASTVWEVRQGGSDTNGGGYVSGGTDWSQQNAAQYSVVDGVTAGTTTITSATANFGTDVVGNIMYVAGGTGSVAANWYQITSRTNNTTIVVDRSTGLTAGTGVTLKIGGALATPGVFSTATGGIGGQLVNGMDIWVKYSATPMACTTTTAGPAGPCVFPNIKLFIRGYDASRGDATGNRPSYQWQTAPGAATYLMTLNNTATQHAENMQFDGNAQANGCGLALLSGFDEAVNCAAINCSGTAGVGFNCVGQCVSCSSSNCLTGFSGAGVATYCYASGGAGQTGFTAGTSFIHCVAHGMATGYSLTGAFRGSLKNCIADACTTAGFNIADSNKLTDCLATNCTGGATGFVLGALLTGLSNCAAYNNNANCSGTPLWNFGPFASGNTLTSLGADPYVNQAGNDFRLNTSNPGGAQLRGLGWGVYGQTDNVDIGAVQHTDPTGGGNVFSGEF